MQRKINLHALSVRYKWDNIKILVLIAFASDVSSGARGLNFGLSLYLYPIFVYVSTEVSGESAYMCRLT